MEKTFDRRHTDKLDILSLKVSYQLNEWSAFRKELSIKDILDEIKSETHKP